METQIGPLRICEFLLLRNAYVPTFAMNLAEVVAHFGLFGDVRQNASDAFIPVFQIVFQVEQS